jgi:choline dehydrogenase
MTLTVCPLRPKSRGWLEIRSADPVAHPQITANYLAHEDDGRTLLAGLRLARKLLATEPLAKFVADEYRPGRACDSNAELLEFARAKGGSIYHPVGSCRMGTDGDAVVDPTLRVRGIEGLRIADAAVMPTIPSGNTNAACMMVGEYAADLIATAH